MSQRDDFRIPAGSSAPSGWGGSQAAAEDPQPNPVEMVLDRLHGRWLWCILTALVLAPALAAAAWFLAPVSYLAQGLIGVERKLDVSVFPTPEAADIDLASYVNEQVMQIRSEATLRAALNDARLAPFRERLVQDDIGAIAEGLVVSTQRGTGLITVGVEADDPDFAEAAARSLVDAYMRDVQPQGEIALRAKLAEAQDNRNKIRNQITSLNEQRLELLRKSPYGTSNLQSIVDDRVAIMRQREAELAEIDAAIERVRAEWTGGGDPPDDVAIEPTQLELDRINAAVPSLRREIDQVSMQLELATKNYSPSHPIYKNVEKKLDFLKAQLEKESAAAREAWKAGPGKLGSYGELKRRHELATSSRAEAKAQIDELTQIMAQSEELARRITQLGSDEAIFLEREKQLDVESKNIKEGRIFVRANPAASRTPFKDRRKQLAAAGVAGGFALSFALFFLWGTIDKRAFGTRQLIGATQGKLLLAGALPDMKEIEGDTDAKDLATNCIHRVRTRIESRRTPGDGYALMVSSPFQGDGKTTLAVGLAWSYAESGHKTLLVDCDFIGQALSFQFGRLGAAGVREALQGEDPLPLVVSAGSPSLSILPVGRDRQFGASRVHPTGLRRLFRELRNQFDVIIVDTGPMTASIEALPVASAVDGVVLSLRRGRSRDRLEECIHDIGSVGAEYLGVVLNWAEKKDCMRYGSVSRMSVEITRALEGKVDQPPAHPLLAAIQPQANTSRGGERNGDAA
jgi:Mrp family chromosome partitioning ATPase/uncharacterized protein involved in exopolysaccharide biosynthesis